MYKILVMEDDPVIYEELQFLLRLQGYEPVDDFPCDLALLDVNLPGENGFEIARTIRETSDIPIIFLTARDAAEDELIGFRIGADDYIHKPYNSAILLARMERLLTRQTSTVSTVRELQLDIANLKVCYHGETIELTKNESRILVRIGVSKSLQTTTLAKQLLLFFAFPVFVPILLTIPTALIAEQFVQLLGFHQELTMYALSAMIVAVMLVIYGIYFFVTFAITKKNVL